MPGADQELLRLKLTERSTHERFLRLSGTAGLWGHPEVLKAAQQLWNEATGALLAYERNAVLIATSGSR